MVTSIQVKNLYHTYTHSEINCCHCKWNPDFIWSGRQFWSLLELKRNWGNKNVLQPWKSSSDSTPKGPSKIRRLRGCTEFPEMDWSVVLPNSILIWITVVMLRTLVREIGCQHLHITCLRKHCNVKTTFLPISLCHVYVRRKRIIICQVFPLHTYPTLQCQRSTSYLK